MAKKWGDFTLREKVAGVSTAAIAVFLIGGVANGISGRPQPISSQPTVTEAASVVTQPVISKKEIVQTETIAYAKESKNDATVASGTSAVTTAGVNGEKSFTYDVTYENDKEVSRVLISEKITKLPVNEVTTVGTYVAPSVSSQSSSSQSTPSNNNGSVSYKNCSAVRAAGKAPIYRGQPGYASHLDRDNDGVGCE